MAEETIKHNQIIEENVFQPATTSADILLAKLNELIKSFKELATLTGKKVPLTDPKTLDEAQQIAAALEKIRDAEKGLTEVQKVQIQAQTIVNSQKKAYRDSLKAETAAVENSTAALRRMTRELANLPAGSKEFNKLAKEAGILKDKIGDAQAAVKAFSSESKLTNAKTLFGQIGDDLKNLNFADAADKAKLLTGVIKSISFAEIIGGIKNFGTAMIELGKSLLLNPFTLILAGVTALGIGLFKLWESFDAGDKVLANSRDRLREVKEEVQNLKDQLFLARLENDKLLGNISEGDASIIKEKISLSEKLNEIEKKRAESIKKINEDAENERGLTQKLSLAQDMLFNLQKAKAIQETNKEFDKQRELAEKISAAKRMGARIKEENEEKKSSEKRVSEVKKVEEKKVVVIEKVAENEIKITENKNEELEIIQHDFTEKINEINNDAREDEAKNAARFRKEEAKKAISDALEVAGQITSGIADGLQKRSDLQQQADQSDIDMKERMLDVQAQLAAGGQENVLAETIAQTAKAEEKKLQDAKKAAKQQELLAEIQVFTDVLSAALKSDKPFFQALGEAGAAAGITKAAFSKLFASFYEGTTDTGTTDSPLDAKGGRVAVLHDNERVVPKRLNDQLDGISNDELVRRAVSPELNSTFFPKIAEPMTVFDFNNRQIAEMNKAITSRLDKIVSKPVESNELGRLEEWSKTIRQENISTIIHHKKSTSRPSLRLNG